MVNPVVSGAQIAPSVLAMPSERPASQPDVAVKVTETAPTELGGNSVNSQATEQQREQASDNADALEKVNETLKGWDTGLRFEMDDEAQRLVVSIVDNKTGEVIRKVPSEAVLKVAKMIIQMQGGKVNTRV